MWEKILVGGGNAQTSRDNDLGNCEVTYETVAVVVIVQTLQDGVGEGMVRHLNPVNGADNILRRRSMMVMEGLGTDHAAKRQQQYPRGDLSETCSHCGGKSTLFSRNHRPLPCTIGIVKKNGAPFREPRICIIITRTI